MQVSSHEKTAARLEYSPASSVPITQCFSFQCPTEVIGGPLSPSLGHLPLGVPAFIWALPGCVRIAPVPDGWLGTEKRELEADCRALDSARLLCSSVSTRWFRKPRAECSQWTRPSRGTGDQEWMKDQGAASVQVSPAPMLLGASLSGPHWQC